MSILQQCSVVNEVKTTHLEEPIAPTTSSKGKTICPVVKLSSKLLARRKNKEFWETGKQRQDCDVIWIFHVTKAFPFSLGITYPGKQLKYWWNFKSRDAIQSRYLVRQIRKVTY